MNPASGSAVAVGTRTAPNNRSFRNVVVTGPLRAIPPSPVPVDVTSTTLLGSIPWYSVTLTSARADGDVNVTVTLLAPAAAPTTFDA